MEGSGNEGAGKETDMIALKYLLMLAGIGIF
jgi:hypothetical protein